MRGCAKKLCNENDEIRKTKNEKKRGRLRQLKNEKKPLHRMEMKEEMWGGI